MILWDSAIIVWNFQTKSSEMKKCKWKIAVFRKLKSYLPNDNFSPESGGSVKPRTAIDAIRTHGTIKLKK